MNHPTKVARIKMSFRTMFHCVSGHSFSHFISRFIPIYFHFTNGTMPPQWFLYARLGKKRALEMNVEKALK